MIVILEGPDCSGKTTLMREAFPARTGWVHEHFGRPDARGPWVQYSELLLRLWKHPMMNTAIDRFLYGELIYGPILRPGSETKFTRSHVRMMERVLLSLESSLICAQTDWDTTRNMWLERKGQELIQKTELLRATYDAYIQLFADPRAIALPRVHYDYKLSMQSSVMRAAFNHASPMNGGPGIGNYTQGVTLMVGEQINHKRAVSPDWPFVAESGSSLWLADVLEELKTSERDFYWINARRPDGSETHHNFVRELRPKRIVALGTAARVWCEKHKLNHVALMHPQFWKRFRNKDPYPLGDALQSPQRELFVEAG